jgi:hypothetical protein
MRAAPLPLEAMPCELTPVDFCAQAIVRCSLRHPRAALEGHCFHITNPSSMPWARFFDIMRRAAGFPDGAVLGVHPYSAWREQHLLKLTGDSHNALLPLVPSFGPDFEHEATPLDYKVDEMLKDFNDGECVRRVLDAAISFMNLPAEVRQLAPMREASAERAVLLCGAIGGGSERGSNSGIVMAQQQQSAGYGGGDAAMLRLKYPATSDALVQTYARYFVEEKFFPSP